MIRVILPAHLSQLARSEKEISVDASPTQRGVIDALELRYPALRGTLPELATGKRRRFIRFYAGEQDLPHESPDSPLPPAVAEGNEPLRIIGAIAGG